MQDRRFAITFAVVVSLFASASAIGQEPMQPSTPQFSRFVSKEGRFRIMFPGQPQFETKELTGKAGRPFRYNSYVADLGSRAYMVAFSDYDSQTTINLDDAVSGTLKAFKHPAVMNQRNTTYFGHAGIAVEANVEDTMRIRFRVFAAGHRLYQIALIAKRDEFDLAEPDFFLNSFWLDQ
jgi:hypothetical protein